MIKLIMEIVNWHILSAPLRLENGARYFTREAIKGPTFLIYSLKVDNSQVFALES